MLIPSASLIEDFLRCSYRAKLREDGAFEAKGIHAITGISAHAAIGADQKSFMERGSHLDASVLLRDARTCMAQELMGYDFPLSDQKDYSSAWNAEIHAYSRLEGLIHAYMQCRTFFNPIMVEKTMEEEIIMGDETYKLSGTVDLIESGFLNDWKTVKNYRAYSTPPLQFCMYKAMADKCKELECADHGFRVIQLKDDGRFKFSAVDINQDHVTVLRKQVGGVLRSINAGIFNPAPPSEWFCGHCGYNKVCDLTMVGKGKPEKIIMEGVKPTFMQAAQMLKEMEKEKMKKKRDEAKKTRRMKGRK